VGNVGAPVSETLMLAWRAAQLISALNVMSDAVLVCDAAGHILDANPAARTLFALRGRSDGVGQARYESAYSQWRGCQSD
jgi:PAS domain-containing protein